MEAGLTWALPLVAPPVEKPPVAVHEVAPVEDHERVEDWPLEIEEGEAEREAVGVATAHPERATHLSPIEAQPLPEFPSTSAVPALHR